MLGQVGGRLAIDMPPESGKPLDHVGGVTDLADLSVADDIDSAFNLFLDGVIHRRRNLRIEFLGIIGLARVARAKQRCQFLAARQTSDVRRPDMRQCDPLSFIAHLLFVCVTNKKAQIASTTCLTPARRMSL